MSITENALKEKLHKDPIFKAQHTAIEKIVYETLYDNYEYENEAQRQEYLKIAEQIADKLMTQQIILSKENMINKLQERYNEFKPARLYKHERKLIQTAIGTIQYLIPDF